MGWNIKFVYNILIKSSSKLLPISNINQSKIISYQKDLEQKSLRMSVVSTTNLEWEHDADPQQSVPNNKSLSNKSRPFEQVGNFCKFSSFSAGSWQRSRSSQWPE